jgi:tetratricopeptide (TPR) repeat protein
MLFDLRGRGRRRTIQVIYASLALLMGGGLVLFGIGGSTSGGLFDALGGGGGGSGNGSDVVQKRVDTLEKRVQVNPRDAGAWAQLASVRFQTATTGEDYDQTTQQFTDKGKAELRDASSAWDRYLALNPPKPDANVARQMVQAYGPNGLQQYDKAVTAMETVIDQSDATSGLYAQLAILAHGAGQDRKATLSRDKALSLAPKDQQNGIKQAIQAGQAQIDQAKAAASTSAQGTGGGG